MRRSACRAWLREHVEHDGSLRRRLVGEVIGGRELPGGLVGGLLASRVDLGQRLALGDPVSGLAQADDADGVVDLVLLGAPPRAEVKRGLPDANGAELRDVPAARSGELADDRRLRERVLIRIATLGPDPALVRLDGRAVCDRLLGAAPAFPL